MKRKKVYQQSRLRLHLVVVCIFIFLAGVVMRLFTLQVLKNASFNIYSTKQHLKVVKIPAGRGKIMDRRKNILSFNIPSWSLYADPKTIEDKNSTAAEVARILGMEKDTLKKKLSVDKSFVWIKRKLSKKTRDKIDSLKIDGLGFVKEPRRFYSQEEGVLGSQVLGFVDVDNIGIEGLELQYNDYLTGQDGYMVIYRDAHQQSYFSPDVNIAGFEGATLILSIDSFIQDVVEKELSFQAKEYGAKSASCVVMDPYTGYILAIANWPTFSANEPHKYDAETRKNRAITDMYEPGSVFKVITAVAALESGEFSIEDMIFCENGSYKIYGHTLHDHRPHGNLSFEDVIVQSSNIGVCKIAQEIGLEQIVKYARAMGLGQKTGIDLPGEVPGLLKPLRKYSKISITAVPMGQEVAVTCLQMASVFSCIANGGYLVKPIVVKQIVSSEGTPVKTFYPKIIKKVMKDETALIMKSILYNVIERGTGRRIRIQGLDIAGKTGTAQKPDSKGGYSHSLFRASFVGFYPVKTPKVVISVVFDEPRKSYYGGVVAGPVFRRIILRIKDYLQMEDQEKGVIRESQQLN